MLEYSLYFDCVEDPCERQALEEKGRVQHHSKQTIIISSAMVIVETTQPPPAAVCFLSVVNLLS